MQEKLYLYINPRDHQVILTIHHRQLTLGALTEKLKVRPVIVPRAMQNREPLLIQSRGKIKSRKRCQPASTLRVNIGVTQRISAPGPHSLWTPNIFRILQHPNPAERPRWSRMFRRSFSRVFHSRPLHHCRFFFRQAQNQQGRPAQSWHRRASSLK